MVLRSSPRGGLEGAQWTRVSGTPIAQVAVDETAGLRSVSDRVRDVELHCGRHGATDDRVAPPFESVALAGARRLSACERRVAVARVRSRGLRQRVSVPGIPASAGAGA